MVHMSFLRTLHKPPSTIIALRFVPFTSRVHLVPTEWSAAQQLVAAVLSLTTRPPKGSGYQILRWKSISKTSFLKDISTQATRIKLSSKKQHNCILSACLFFRFSSHMSIRSHLFWKLLEEHDDGSWIMHKHRLLYFSWYLCSFSKRSLLKYFYVKTPEHDRYFAFT